MTAQPSYYYNVHDSILFWSNHVMNVKPYVTCLCVCVWLILCYLFSACFQAHENQIKCTMHRHTRRVEIKQYTDYWILYAEYTSSIEHDKINASKYIYSSRSWIVLYFSFALLFRIDVIFWEAWNSNISNEITKNHEKKYLMLWASMFIPS